MSENKSGILDTEGPWILPQSKAKSFHLLMLASNAKVAVTSYVLWCGDCLQPW